MFPHREEEGSQGEEDKEGKGRRRTETRGGGGDVDQRGSAENRTDFIIDLLSCCWTLIEEEEKCVCVCV